LTYGGGGVICARMKATTFLFCLAVTLVQIVRFTFCMRNNANPMQTWEVTNGVIHCNGSAIGYLRTKQSYSNFVITVEWRFVKVTPKANNTGVLVDMQLPDKVWPMCVQNQGKSGRQGDFFVMAGAECKEHLALGKDANTPVAFTGPSAENPVGEWDTNVTVCAGDDVKAIINGKLLNEITECTVSSGFVGIQSEGADFEIREMYLEPLRMPRQRIPAQNGASTDNYSLTNVILPNGVNSLHPNTNTKIVGGPAN
jgi:hypothetical protein